MAVLILAMMAATIVEKVHGTDAAFSSVYHSWWFIALWAVAAVAGVIWLFRSGTYRAVATLMIHLSFVVVLVGALVSHLFGHNGTMHLRVGESVSEYTDVDGGVRMLPFSLRLESFDIDYYRGSLSPMDYSSTVGLPGGGLAVISMNHILKYKGFRFYQQDYDEDLKGSSLAVSHDPCGTGITYAGYLLLLLSFIGFFFQRNTGFRAALRRLSASSLCLLAFALSASAAPRVLPEDVADQLGGLYIYYNDRITTVETMAREYCLKIYGKAGVQGFSANQVLSGMLFYPSTWADVPIKLKAKDKGGPVEEEKRWMLRQMAGAAVLTIYPYAPSDSVRREDPSLREVMWYSPASHLPSQMPVDQMLFIRKSMNLMGEKVARGDMEGLSAILTKLKTYQEKTALGVLPSASHVRAERLYNRISRPMVPFMASITLGLLLFVFCGIRISRGRRVMPAGLGHGLAVLAALLFVYLSVVLSLRWYVSGHAPFAGSYSVMMLMAWLSSLFMMLIYRKFPLALPLGFLLAGFTMLMASMASANPRITHLMPVLQSPLLSVHVLSMILSYTLFGMVALNGVMGVCVRRAEAREMLRDVSLVLLTPAVFILTFGTFLGAVWANVSWGNYWAWDPKETWALVTILVYAATLHSRSLSGRKARGFASARFFHWYTIFAFLSVLITYFGVNLILGGMHSYA